MQPVSGKIDRKRLPDLSHLPRSGEPEAEDARLDTPARARDQGEVTVLDADAGMDRECEEVLAICQAIFETPLGLDDGFAEAGGHSILIARLAQQLRAAGWVVPVRALLSDCNTARKVAARPRVLEQISKAFTSPVKSDERALNATRPRQRCSRSDTSPPSRSCSRLSCTRRSWWPCSASSTSSNSGRFSRPPTSRRSSSTASSSI